jgi:restriction system protein
MWEVRVTHPGLHKFRVVKGVTKQEADLKAALQVKVWNEQWEHVQLARARQRGREQAAHNKELKKLLVEEQTKEAEEAISAVENLLRNGVARDCRVEWSNLKDHSDYPEPKPAKPQPLRAPSEPLRLAFAPKLNWFTGLISPIREKRLAEADQRFRAAHSAWRAEKAKTEESNRRSLDQYEHQLADWETRKATWLEEQRKRNSSMDEKQASYLRSDPRAIEDYCEMVLNASEYPAEFPSAFELDYIAETRMLVVDYSLPTIQALPSAKAYRYIATRDEIQPVAVAESWLNRTYDSVCIKFRSERYMSSCNRTQPTPLTPQCLMAG